MRATKVILGAVAVGLLILGGAVAYLPLYLQDHKEILERYASESFGQPVRIAGDVSFDWVPAPAIGLEDVQIENPRWSGRPPLAHAARVELQFDLPALLAGHVRISLFVVRRAEIHLATDRQCKNNWTSPWAEGGKAGLPLRSLLVLDSAAVFGAPGTPARQIGVRRLKLANLGGGSIRLDAEGTYGRLPVSISAAAGPENHDRTRRWPFEVQADLAGTDIRAEGSTNAPFQIQGIEADTALKGANLRSLGDLFLGNSLPEGPFQIAFHVARAGEDYRLSNIVGNLDAPSPLGRTTLSTGEVRIAGNAALSASLAGGLGDIPATGRLRLGGIDSQHPDAPRQLEVAAQLGDAELAGTLLIALNGPRPHITGDLGFTKINPSRFAASPPTNPGSQKPSDWNDSRLPVGALQAFDADVQLTADLVIPENTAGGRLSASVSLAEGLMRLEGINATLPGVKLTGRATLDTRPHSPTLDLALDAKTVRLPEAFFFLSTQPHFQGAVQSLSLRAKVHGETPRSLLRNLRGDLTASEVRLRPRNTKEATGGEISLTKPRLTVAPDQAVRLRSRVASRQQMFDIDLAGGTLSDLLWQNQPWPTLKVTARGIGERGSVEVLGTLGPLPSLIAGRDLQVDLTARWPGIQVTAKGTLARLGDPSGAKLAFKGSGDSLSSLGRSVGMELPAGPPFAFTARLETKGDRVELRGVKATSGPTDIQGALSIRSGRKTRIEGTLTSNFIDLTPYLAAGTSGSWQWAKPLPFGELLDLDGSLALKAHHIRMRDFGVDDANIDAALDSGSLRLSARAEQERITANVEIKPEQSQWRLSLSHHGKLDMALLMEEEKVKAISHLPATLDLRLSGVGTSFQGILETASGHVQLVLGAGRIHKKEAALPLGGILVSLLDVVNPANLGKSFDDLRCAVLQFDVNKGIATSTRGLAVQTEGISALGGGAINLGTREIELRFKTVRRKGIGIGLLGIADKVIRITGTIEKPRATVDPAGLIIQGGAAWATSGLSLLYEELVNQLTTTRNPCEAVMSRGDRKGG